MHSNCKHPQTLRNLDTFHHAKCLCTMVHVTKIYVKLVYNRVLYKNASIHGGTLLDINMLNSGQGETVRRRSPVPSTSMPSLGAEAKGGGGLAAMRGCVFSIVMADTAPSGPGTDSRRGCGTSSAESAPARMLSGTQTTAICSRG